VQVLKGFPQNGVPMSRRAQMIYRFELVIGEW